MINFVLVKPIIPTVVAYLYSPNILNKACLQYDTKDLQVCMKMSIALG